MTPKSQVEHIISDNQQEKNQSLQVGVRKQPLPVLPPTYCLPSCLEFRTPGKYQQRPRDMQSPTATAARRLQSVGKHTNSAATFNEQENEEIVLVLPDGGKVGISLAAVVDEKSVINLNDSPILAYTISKTQSFAFDISAFGTQWQGATTHIPKYNLLDLSAPTTSTASQTNRANDVSIANIWIAIYALFTIYPDNEHIPVTISDLSNVEGVKAYLLGTGLARTYPKSDTAPKTAISGEDVIFLCRMAFWQGAGTKGFHRLSWTPNTNEPFPTVPTYTRNEKVSTMHPLRPSKPQSGEILYRRWCSDVKQMFDITYFDLEGVHDGSKSLVGPNIPSRHLSAFHKWHNDERVNAAWGERGSLEAHRLYVETVHADPHVLPCMMSWDGELMGYCELTYIKEDHIAQNYPAGVVPGDWERGLHVLVGESKFQGGGRSEIWLRNLVHYLMLADPRTDRVVGEPRYDNKAIIRAVQSAGFHINTVFDFPYKRSALILNPREGFFKLCRLR